MPDHPAAPEPSGPAPTPLCSPRTSAKLDVLRHRSDFLAAARARRQGTPGFLLQARERAGTEAADPTVIRVGFTCSRKVGNAVARNRARRRLREAARAVLPELGRPGWDYVLIGRETETAQREFTALLDDLRRALARVHAGTRPP